MILGADAAAGLLTWERCDEVRDLATIVVVERPGAAPAAAPRRAGGGQRVEVPSLEVSSTDLRARAVDGRPLDYLVTHEVADWIEAHDLYRDDAVTAPTRGAGPRPPAAGTSSRRRRRRAGG